MATPLPHKQDDDPRARPAATTHLQLPSIDIQYKQRLGGGNWLDLIEVEYCKPTPDSTNDQALSPAPTDRSTPTTTSALPKRFAYEVCCRCHSKTIDQTISLADDAIEGLIDTGESIAEAALRELWEETGYHGMVVSQSPALPCEPGLTSSKSCIVHIEIDGDALQNSKPRAHGGEDEWSIQTVLLPLDDLLPSLLDLTHRYHPKLVIDSRLYSFAQGLVLGGQPWNTVNQRK
ncbi:hypothetical protein H4R35_000977 [Dimargaris xerosporica]|nr:hypothetical protein H4R35_000977 [Dimargaris xerosporica]